MPRKKTFELSPLKKDTLAEKINNIDISDLKQRRKKQERRISEKVNDLLKTAQKYHAEKRLSRDRRLALGLYNLEEAYDIVRKNDIDISFRAFCGRIERKSIPSVKIGRKRYIPSPILKDWVELHQDFLSVRKAYNKLKKKMDINFRAFIGRVEKQSVPSIKIGTQRWVPKSAIESLTHVADNYYDVAASVKQLKKNKIKIKRNTFERRLDRGRIPHIKIGGRRYVHENTLDELIDVEKSRKKR